MVGRVNCATSARRFPGVITALALNPGSVCVTQTGVACSVTKVSCMCMRLHKEKHLFS